MIKNRSLGNKNNSMHTVPQIRKFLEKKFKIYNLTRNTFAEKSNIPYRNISYILTGNRKNISLTTIIKIASYFNCSIDEVVGRENYISNTHYKYYDSNTVLDNYNKNLQQFLYTKIQEHKLNPYKLSQILGFNDNAIARFINDHTNKKTLTTPIIVTIADYFDVLIDNMIGRLYK